MPKHTETVVHPFACHYKREYRGGDESFPPITDEQLDDLVKRVGPDGYVHPNRFRGILGDQAIANWRFQKKCVALTDEEFKGLREMVRKSELPHPDPDRLTKEQEELAPRVTAFMCMLIATIDKLKEPKPGRIEQARSIVFEYRHSIDQDKQEDLAQRIALEFSDPATVA